MILTALLLIFLSGCSVVQVEIRDKGKQAKPQTTQREAGEKREKKREEGGKSSTDRLAEQTPQRQSLALQPPVKGKANPTERGYRITTSCGEFFRSVSDGRVLYVGDEIRGYGWVVMVDGDDPFVYVYGRAESPMVKRGERVKKGQVLGKVGKMQEGCGLLFEVRDKEGRPVVFQLVL